MESQEYFDIVLTDIQLHVQKPKHPAPFDRGIVKSIRNQKAGRTHTAQKLAATEVAFPLSFQNEIEELERTTGKKVRIFIHAQGLPLKVGADTTQWVKANKHRVKKVVDKRPKTPTL